MLHRGIAVLSSIALSATVVACTAKSDPPPNTSSAVESSASSTSLAASPTPSAVPIDQIPPGNPVEWVPAGVPTAAKYREPGDVVPKFTQDMFKNVQGGALDAARYYIDARNWAYATMSAAPFLLICDGSNCRKDASFYTSATSKHQHVIGARETPSAPTVVAAPASSGSDWVVQLPLSVAAAELVDSTGKSLQTQPSTHLLTNLYMKWNGKMWRVAKVNLASSQ